MLEGESKRGPCWKCNKITNDRGHFPKQGGWKNHCKEHLGEEKQGPTRWEEIEKEISNSLPKEKLGECFTCSLCRKFKLKKLESKTVEGRCLLCTGGE